MYVNARPPEYNCAKPPVAAGGNHVNSFHSVDELPLCSAIPGRGWQQSAQLLNGLMKKKRGKNISALIGAIEEQMFGNMADVLVSSAERGYIQQLMCERIDNCLQGASGWPRVRLRAS